MGCKYRFGLTINQALFHPEPFQVGSINVCKKYQPDGDDGQYAYFDDDWNAPEIKQ